MKPNTMKHLLLLRWMSLCWLCSLGSAMAQSTAFTYQGRLTHGVIPAQGIYDFRFALYDAVTIGTALGASVTNASVAVNSGLFTAPLDFGVGVFTGVDLWLDVSVRTNGAATEFTPLEPRQRLTPTPYALHALTAAGVMSGRTRSA